MDTSTPHASPRSRFRLGLAALLLSASWPASARAQPRETASPSNQEAAPEGPPREGARSEKPGEPSPEPAAPSGRHQHGGFFFRVNIGGGFLSYTTNDGPTETTATGAGNATALSLGFSTRSGWAYYLEILAVSTDNPRIKENGLTVRPEAAREDLFVSSGLGASYYFPSNLFVGASIGSAGARVTVDGDIVLESAPALGLGAMVGKEWWVSKSWALGLAANATLATASDALTASAYSLLLSASYN